LIKLNKTLLFTKFSKSRGLRVILDFRKFISVATSIVVLDFLRQSKAVGKVLETVACKSTCILKLPFSFLNRGRRSMMLAVRDQTNLTGFSGLIVSVSTVNSLT